MSTGPRKTWPKSSSAVAAREQAAGRRSGDGLTYFFTKWTAGYTTSSPRLIGSRQRKQVSVSTSSGCGVRCGGSGPGNSLTKHERWQGTVSAIFIFSLICFYLRSQNTMQGAPRLRERRYPAASSNTDTLYGTGLAISSCSLTALMPVSHSCRVVGECGSPVKYTLARKASTFPICRRK